MRCTPSKSTDTLEHCLLVVGYGKDPETGDYWLGEELVGHALGRKGMQEDECNRKSQCSIATAATAHLLLQSTLMIRTSNLTPSSNKL